MADMSLRGLTERAVSLKAQAVASLATARAIVNRYEQASPAQRPALEAEANAIFSTVDAALDELTGPVRTEIQNQTVRLLSAVRQGKDYSPGNTVVVLLGESYLENDRGDFVRI